MTLDRTEIQRGIERYRGTPVDSVYWPAAPGPHEIPFVLKRLSGLIHLRDFGAEEDALVCKLALQKVSYDELVGVLLQYHVGRTDRLFWDHDITE